MQDVKYTKPATLQEAVKILQETGPTARVLAGGTDIIVMARERRRDTSVFVAGPIQEVARPLFICCSASTCRCPS